MIPTTGLPPTAGRGDIQAIDGRFPSRLWIGVADGGGCLVYTWRTDRWVGAGPPAAGSCHALRAWTSDAAIAVVDTQTHVDFAAYGAAPAVVPANQATGMDPRCSGTFSHVYYLEAFKTGEVVAVVGDCGGGAYAVRWPRGARKGVGAGVYADSNAAFVATIPRPNLVLVRGITHEPHAHSLSKMVFRTGAWHTASVTEAPYNQLYLWILYGEKLTVSETEAHDGFIAEAVRAGRAGHVFVAGPVLRGGRRIATRILRVPET